MDSLYGPILLAAKISILLQFLRIFVPIHRGVTYWTVHCLIWTNLVFCTIASLVVIFQCHPRAKVWDPSISGHCVSGNLLLIISATINVVSDISILVLPIHSIFQLQLPLKRKIGVSAVFAIGIV